MHNSKPAFDFLRQHSIAYDFFQHDPFHSVQDSSAWAKMHPGCHLKNLLLRNKKKTAYFLLFMPGAKRICFKSLKAATGHNLSFASPASVQALLNSTPGHVSPFVLTTAPNSIQILIDEEVLAAPHVFFHPLVNHQTVRVSGQGFQSLLQCFSHGKIILTINNQ